jgi:hypothetical protein
MLHTIGTKKTLALGVKSGEVLDEKLDALSQYGRGRDIAR